MDISLLLGGVLFRFHPERDMVISDELRLFLHDPAEPAEVTVRVSWDWEHASLPSAEMAGQDAILNYYQEGETRYCLTRGGPNGYIACTRYTPDFSEIICTINEKPFLCPPKALASVLRMLPMREIFLHFHTLFLHSSQMVYAGRAVLFSAPSGTGKTTQARLWEKYRGAEVASNDRTLTRKRNGTWMTSGYPVDGSEPVFSNRSHPLGALVLLQQGPENTIHRLGPVKALPRLMQQVVLDGWSGEARAAATNLLIDLMEDIPVYLLTCTPDERAVNVLEQTLIEEGVI